MGFMRLIVSPYSGEYTYHALNNEPHKIYSTLSRGIYTVAHARLVKSAVFHLAALEHKKMHPLYYHRHAMITSFLPWRSFTAIRRKG